MVKRTDEIGPQQIVELARQYIRHNLQGDLRPAAVAKAIGIGVQDLKGRYRCSTTTSIKRDVKKIRLHALYEEVRINPNGDEESQVRQFGLKPGEKLTDEFEQEFWISLEDHRQHSRLHLGHTTHTQRKFSPQAFT